MKVITAEMMREIDKTAIQDKGIAGLDLMEAAGTGVTERIIDLLGDARGKSVSIFCGKGNNAGDGFVVARLLSESDVAVKVFLSGDPSEFKGDALHNFERLPEKITVIKISSDDDFLEIAEQLPHEHIVVDALLGTGIKGAVKDDYAKVIEMINTRSAQIVSIDIPSGVEGSSGKVGRIAVEADHTVTMAVPKLGLFLQPGSSHTGDVSVVDIGVPDDVLENFEMKYEILDSDIAKSLLPKRKQVTHKGDYGRVLIIGGSRGMVGAVSLAAGSVLRTGAGMVVVASPESVQKSLEIKLEEAMSKPLSENEFGTLTPDAAMQLKPYLDWADVVAIGPGLGVNDDTIAFFGRFLEICEHPLLIDADGIKCASAFRDVLKQRNAPVMITPHPGELASFLEISQDEVMDNYFETTLKTAFDYNITVLLKVHRSVTANPEGYASINTTGNSGMATAGSGDVLTGIVAGLMAQGANVYDSARLGAFLHGLSGDIAASKLGEYSLIAGDLIECLPFAIMRILTGE